MLAIVRAEAPHPLVQASARPLVMREPPAARPHPHDCISRRNVAHRLARVIGYRFGGEYDERADYGSPPYFVPHDALTVAQANALGIRGPDDLFGGVVPHAFVATKAITHPLVSPGATAPDGWSPLFAEWAGDAVLRGYTAFAHEDARDAVRILLREGPVRIKKVSGIGGAGQRVVTSEREADDALAAIDAREISNDGVAVEEHLADAVTFSVGVVTFGALALAYCGTQRTTRNAHGVEVYGGSTLDVVRGGFESLLAGELPGDRRAAIALARSYDAAAFAAYPGAFASRRNYDVLLGRDGARRLRTGVLEQSWRIGGASAAEVLALEAFTRDAARTRVRCATVEVYDDQCEVPAGAFVHYRGVDARVGPLTKYAIQLDESDP